MNLVIWFLLVAIGVSDAQRHRIPNHMVGLLLLAVIISVLQQPGVDWIIHVKGFLITFVVGFGLYLVRAMAGGDVKLLAVLGLWLGDGMMWQVTPYIVLSGGVIGVFFLALHMASSGESVLLQVKAYSLQKITPGWKTQQPLVIPFAPAIVIGLAYYFYVH